MRPIIQEMADDYEIFLRMLWEPRKMEPFPIQVQIARNFYMSPNLRRVLLAFRGEGKTEMNASYGVWKLYREPDSTGMILSAREQRSIDIVSAMLRTIKTYDFLSHLVPSMDDLAGRKRFTVGCRQDKSDTQPSVVAYGVGSQITGNHVDWAIPDDIEIPQNSVTVEAREKIKEVFRELEDIINPGGEILGVGTPQTEDSVYFGLPEKYIITRVPAEYPDPKNDKDSKHVPEFVFKEMQRTRSQPGDPVMPEKFGRAELLEKRAQQGLSRYSLQMLLDPAAADETRYPLKLRDFIVWNVDGAMAPRRLLHGKTKPAREIPSVGMGNDQFYWPIHVDEEYAPYERSIMYVDPAGMGADEVGYYVGKTLNAHIFITAGGGMKGGYDDATMMKLITTAIEQDVKEIHVESNWGGGKDGSMYIDKLRGMLLRTGLKIEVFPVHNTGQKEIRIIETLEPAMNSHRVVLDERVARDQELMQQVTRMQRERGCLKHDDRVEALAGVVGVLREHLVLDPDILMQEAEERERLELLNEFLGEAGLRSTQTRAPSMLRSRGSKSSRFRRRRR